VVVLEMDGMIVCIIEGFGDDISGQHCVGGFSVPPADADGYDGDARDQDRLDVYLDGTEAVVSVTSSSSQASLVLEGKR
jgi:hypothetical protein